MKFHVFLTQQLCGEINAREIFDTSIDNNNFFVYDDKLSLFTLAAVAFDEVKKIKLTILQKIYFVTIFFINFNLKKYFFPNFKYLFNKLLQKKY